MQMDGQTGLEEESNHIFIFSLSKMKSILGAARLLIRKSVVEPNLYVELCSGQILKPELHLMHPSSECERVNMMCLGTEKSTCTNMWVNEACSGYCSNSVEKRYISTSSYFRQCTSMCLLVHVQCILLI